MSLRVIAEAGENHLGDIDRALEMVRRAAGTGADFVKFQSYNVEDLSPETPLEAREWVSRVQLSVDDHGRLRDEAERSGITFLSMAVNVRWATVLQDLGCRAIKLASVSLTNHPLLRFAGEHFDEVFISTGMGNVEEIGEALEAVGDRAKVTVLHCVSMYPVPDEHASLLSMTYLRERFSCSVGYSDHTIGNVACIAACALGAELLEKHFTLDKTLEGTDHILSADPAEMADLVHSCHRVAAQLGTADKHLSEGEMEARVAMRSMFPAG